MRSRYVLAIITALGLALAPLAASAHVLKTDGAITGVLHINPNDDAVAGQAATLDFILADSANQLKLSQCDCTLVVTEAGRPLTSQALPAAALTSDTIADLPYTFPRRDVYTVSLQGQPQAGATFQTFTLSYDIRVDLAAAPHGPSALTWWIIGAAGAMALVVAAWVVQEIRYRRRQPTQK